MGTWPPTPGRLVRSLLARITALADQVRAAVRREPRGRQLAWLAIAALLVMGPLGFNLARESGFEASRVILPRELGPYPAIHDPRYYRSLFADPVLREEMGSTAGGEVGDIDDVTIRSGPEPATLTVTVRAQTPERAQAFVNALGPQIAGATKRQLARVVTQDAATLRERLLGTSLSVGERRTLRGRLRRLEGNPKLQEPRVLLGPPGPDAAPGAVGGPGCGRPSRRLLRTPKSRLGGSRRSAGGGGIVGVIPCRPSVLSIGPWHRACQ
jgi:hypothetical protein